MTTIQHTLACNIVRESFGELAKDVTKLLIREISCPFSEIVRELILSEKLVNLSRLLQKIIQIQKLIYNFRLPKFLQFLSIMSWCSTN